MAEVDGKEFEANKDFARDVGDSAQFTLGLLGQEGATYDSGSDTFRQIDNFIKQIDDGTINFQGGNSVQLNAGANSFLNKVEAGLIQSQGDALDGGASVDNAVRYVNAAEYVFSEIAMFGEPTSMPVAPPGTVPDSPAGGSGAGGLALGGVSETLDEAKNADTSTDKASLIQDAIAGLIDALTGGGAGGAPGDGGSGASPTQTGLGQTINDAIGALQGGGEVAAPSAPLPPAIETTEY
ncbi:MAG: hypothetical protein AAF264_04550, partial [Pseudomonadota bacterium]